MSYTKEQTRDCIYGLTHSQEYERVKEESERLGSTRGGWFGGTDSAFNPIVALIRRKGKAFMQPIWRACSRRQIDKGIRSPEKEKKAQYMRDLRNRKYAASTLKSRLDGVELHGRELQEYRSQIHSLWVYYCNLYAAKYRPGELHNERRKEFWALIDRHLEAASNEDEIATLQVLGKDGRIWLDSLVKGGN